MMSSVHFKIACLGLLFVLAGLLLGVEDVNYTDTGSGTKIGFITQNSIPVITDVTDGTGDGEFKIGAGQVPIRDSEKRSDRPAKAGKPFRSQGRDWYMWRIPWTRPMPGS